MWACDRAAASRNALLVRGRDVEPDVLDLALVRQALIEVLDAFGQRWEKLRLSGKPLLRLD
jgi:hypothetical protein